MSITKKIACICVAVMWTMCTSLGRERLLKDVKKASKKDMKSPYSSPVLQKKGLDDNAGEKFIKTLKDKGDKKSKASKDELPKTIKAGDMDPQKSKGTDVRSPKGTKSPADDDSSKLNKLAKGNCKDAKDPKGSEKGLNKGMKVPKNKCATFSPVPSLMPTLPPFDLPECGDFAPCPSGFLCVDKGTGGHCFKICNANDAYYSGDSTVCPMRSADGKNYHCFVNTTFVAGTVTYGICAPKCKLGVGWCPQGTTCQAWPDYGLACL